MPERVTAHASPVIGERARAKPPVTTERIRILPKADRIPADPVVEKVDYDRAVAEAKQIVGQVEKSEERLMRVRFWGVRGSTPTPQKENMGYGGNTSCIEIRTDTNQILIFDGLARLSGGSRPTVLG